MSFAEILDHTDINRRVAELADVTPAQVEAVLGRETIDFSAFLKLISPAAKNYLEPMAVRAQAITWRRFGKVILLYAPLYLSNVCSNACVYCGFNVHRKIPRITLSLDDVLAEAETLKQAGFGHLLLVCGEAPREVPVSLLAKVLNSLRGDFPSLSLEIYPLSGPAYAQMVDAGADGLTLYQETYDREIYAAVHPSGRKRNFDWRLDAAERAGQAGFRRLGIGALLGLGDWRYDGIAVALHADYLMKKFWRTHVTISFPRLRNTPDEFRVPHPIDDTDLVQLMLALRLFLHDAGMVISTREKPAFRDCLIPLAVTQMSAGSKTEPGGYRHPDSQGAQFAVDDDRSPLLVAQSIREAGYEPVWKDWDRVMHQGYHHADQPERNAQGRAG